MEDLLQLQLLARQQRTPYAVATIVEATGSTPRTEGKMLVYADGRSAGTIGGGLAELRAKKDAADAIRCGKNRLVRYEVVPQAAGTWARACCARRSSRASSSGSLTTGRRRPSRRLRRWPTGSSRSRAIFTRGSPRRRSRPGRFS